MPRKGQIETLPDFASDLKVRRRRPGAKKKPGTKKNIYGQVSITYPLPGGTVPTTGFVAYGTDPNHEMPTGTLVLTAPGYGSTTVSWSDPNWSLQFPSGGGNMTAGNNYTLAVKDSNAGSEKDISVNVQTVD